MNELAQVQVVSSELLFEQQYAPIALTLDINLMFINEGKYQQFTIKYSKFSNKNETTPLMLVEANAHATAFIEYAGYTGDKATNAVVWVISRIWKKKGKNKFILTPELQPKYAEAEAARKQKVEIHKAVSKIAKGKAEDSFEVGLKINVSQLLGDAGAHQLMQLTQEVEVEK